MLAAGKDLFVARCARCHDERGDKPLKTGEERRAVTLYISSLLKAKNSEEKATARNLTSSAPWHPRMRWSDW